MVKIILNKDNEVEKKIEQILAAKLKVKQLGDELVVALNATDNDTRCDYTKLCVSNNISTVLSGGRRACPYGPAHKHLSKKQQAQVNTNTSEWVRNWARTEHLRLETHIHTHS